MAMLKERGYNEGTLKAARFLLLDRDGIINQRIEGGYVTLWEKFVFLPGALEALRHLTEKGFHLIVCSNQAGVGKGEMTAEDLQDINGEFLRQVEAYGGQIRKVYFCVHCAEDGCACRKPKPGLLLQAQAEHHFHFEDTFFVGDSESDLQAAHSAGCPSILVSEAPGTNWNAVPRAPQAIFRSLREAARFLVHRLEGSSYDS